MTNILDRFYFYDYLVTPVIRFRDYLFSAPIIHLMSNYGCVLLVVLVMIILFLLLLKRVYGICFFEVLREEQMIYIPRLILTMLVENLVKLRFFFFEYICTLFSLIFAANLLGMIPYSVAFTSHIIITFFLSSLSFFTAIYIGIRCHGKVFLTLFMPPGAPFVLYPLLIFIEFISYNARIFSLAIRLFANIMSGHTLLKILTGFVWLLLLSPSLFAIGLWLIVLIVNILEFAIAGLQAYVFAILSCVYLNEAMNLH